MSWLKGKARDNETREKISRTLKKKMDVPLEKRHTVGGYRVAKTLGKISYQHRLVMEKVIGRKLLKREVVHHVDKNKLNNTRKNLLFLRHDHAHQRLHRFAERHELPIALFNFPQPWITTN